jgi:hypothetical protein
LIGPRLKDMRDIETHYWADYESWKTSSQRKVEPAAILILRSAAL